MSITRKMLKAMGLEDEKIEQIIEAHTDTVNALKDERDKLKDDAEKLVDVQKELDGLKANNGDAWKDKYETLKKTFDDYKSEVTTKAEEEKVKSAYTDLLKESKVDEKRIDAILKITDLKSMKVGNDGKLVDADKLKEGIKKEWSAFITTTGTRGTNVETPPDGNAGSKFTTRADIYAKDEKGRYKLSTAERQKALIDNPDLMRT